MSRPFLVALSFLSVLAGVFCGNDKSSPTQPVSRPTMTVAAMTATPTVPAAATATPTRSAATATPTVPPAVHIVNVGQGGNNFVDSQSGNSTTTIRAGATVMWTWVSGTHSTTSGTCCTADGKWDSGTKSSGSFSHTFPTAGNFPYFCSVHLAAMTGNVVVNP